MVGSFELSRLDCIVFQDIKSKVFSGSIVVGETKKLKISRSLHVVDISLFDRNNVFSIYVSILFYSVRGTKKSIGNELCRPIESCNSTSDTL